MCPRVPSGCALQALPCLLDKRHHKGVPSPQHPLLPLLPLGWGGELAARVLASGKGH